MKRQPKKHLSRKNPQVFRILFLLSVATLVLASGAVSASAQTINVTEDNCFPYPLLPQMYNYTQTTTGWMGVAVVSETGQNVYVEARDGDPGQVLNTSSTPGETNFLVHQWAGGSGNGYFQTTTDEGPVNIQHLVDFDPGQGPVIFGTEYSNNYGSVGYDCGLLRVWEANLVAGHTYELSLDSDADQGHLEIRAALLQTGGANGWLSRADAIWETSARENPGNPGQSFTVPATGSYALVIFRNGYHNLDVWDSDYHFTLEDHGSSSSFPDLVVQSISPSSSPENLVFDLDITLRNNGNAASGACVTNVWVDGALVCAQVPTPAIAPQQSVQITACSIGPFSVGSISILAEVDYGDDVDESDEDNNQGSRNINIIAQLPDLIVSSITPTEAVPYHPVSFEIVVSNIGLADAPASATSFSLDFTQPCGPLTTPFIPAGGSVTVTCQVASLDPGYHTLGATADADFLVSESSNSNNSLGSFLNAQGPDLTVLEFTPSSASNEDPIEFQFLVLNQGNADMPSCFADITNNGTSLGTPFLIPVIPAGQEVWVTSSLYDPLPAGTAHINICVDENDLFEEYDEGNNCLGGDVDVLVLQATVFPDGHGDYPTIQAAVDAVAPGGVVSLAYGTFTGPGNRDISFNGKDLTVRGSGRSPDRCTIDIQGSSADPHRAFLFEDGETAAATLENFTIINGWMNDRGGAVRIDGAQPTLHLLVFRDNRSSLHDGGAVSSNSSFILNDCLFDNNQASGEPPAIVAKGGAVSCSGNYFNVELMRNTFVNNQANEASAVWVYAGNSGVVLIDNCLLVDNSSSQGTVDGLGDIVIDIECSNVWGNNGGDWAGAIGGQYGYEDNISVDPLFCDFSGGDFTLHADSPCAEENVPDCGQIGALGVGCAPSGQSVYTVLADGSGDFSTIQAALNTAHSGDVIELGDGIFSGSGNRDLGFGGKDIVLRSQSGNAADCIIDCGGSASQLHRAFSFYSGETEAAEVSNITIRYGYHSQGGAVSIDGASPTFRGCVFYANQAQVQGGAVFGESSDSQFLQCEFRLNHVSGSGAAALLSDGDYLVEECSFSGNSADTSGGGLQLVDCQGTVVESCVLYSNTAGTAGGGINVESSQVTFNRCTVDGNTAPVGAGMACDSSSMILLGSTNVTGSWTGEGVFCEEYTDINIACTNIWGNQGGDWVGAVAAMSGSYGNLSLDPQYCSPGVGDYHLNILSPVNEDNNPCGQVGAFAVGCGIQTFVVSPDGSGDYPTIQEAIDASAWGDTIRLSNGVFTGDGNRDLHFDGKAIALISDSGNPALCIIDCNGSSADIHRGMDFTAVDGPGALVSGLTIRNAWKNYGGAIRISGGHPTITNCGFINNVSNNGAAIALANAAGPAISDCLFVNNTATNAAGGIHVQSGSDPVVSGCVFYGNFATWGGGGIYVYGTCAPTFEYCLFYNNGSDHWGGAYHTQEEGAEAQFLFCTFDGNYAPDGGVGYSRGGSHAEISQSILSNSPQGEAVYCGNGGTTTVSCSNVWGNADGDWVSGIAGQGGVDGNLSLDPEYCDPSSGLFTLASGSPCLPQGNSCDLQMGAYAVGCSGGATTRLVQPDGSGTYATIEAAVDASYHGDTILLADGVFSGEGNRDVNLDGLQIVIGSESGNAEACIIDCEGSEGTPRRAFRINSGEGPGTVIENLTVTGGWHYSGAGIQIVDASPVVTGCRFVDNAGSNGAGIYVGGASAPYVENCYFSGNSVSNAGGGLRFTGSGGIVENCHFTDNFGHWGGGGIYIYLSSVSVQGCLFENNSCQAYGSDLEIQSPDLSVNIDRCTFVGGSSSDGVVRIRAGSVPEFASCLFAFSQQGQAISCDNTSDVVISCSDVYGNAGGDWVGCLSGLAGSDGNFSADPQFCGNDSGDYQLESSSPCLPDGNSCGLQIGAFGLSCVVSPVAEELLPVVFTLDQNYPNPFNPSTTISFSLPRGSQTSLRIYDVQGRLVNTLVQEALEAGTHSFVWRGDDHGGRRAASGVYWYLLKTDEVTATRKMMLLK